METLAVVEEVETDWLTVESKVYVIAAVKHKGLNFIQRVRTHQECW